MAAIGLRGPIYGVLQNVRLNRICVATSSSFGTGCIDDIRVGYHNRNRRLATFYYRKIARSAFGKLAVSFTMHVLMFLAARAPKVTLHD